MFTSQLRKALPKSYAPLLNTCRLMQASERVAAFSVAAKRFPNEPTEPLLKTAFPGPLSVASMEEYGAISCNKQQQFPVDLESSLGNYVADADGNMYLDVFTSIACIGMGYNHPTLLEASRSDLMKAVLVNRTGMQMNPPQEYEDIHQRAFMDVAPKGMTRSCGAMCGTCSVEAAFKHCFITYSQNQRGGLHVMPTKEELDSCMLNEAPGTPNHSILSLKSGFHGRLLGALSATRTNPTHKIGFPAFDWPAAEPPRYQYPLEENVEYNRAQDESSLAEVRSLISQWKSEKGSQVVAIIVEPIMSEGGDNQLSAAFAQGLQDITKEHGIYFIVDEVQTGVCQTGSFWAHEQWNLRESPDFVTFAKKMQACGFYHNDNTIMTMPYRHFNTYTGDPVRAILCAEQNKVIKEDKLSELATETGAFVAERLTALSKKYPETIQNVRGKGTYLAFDCETPEMRNELISKLKKQGINQGGCGSRTMRLRPTLYFEKKHAELYLDALERAI